MAQVLPSQDETIRVVIPCDKAQARLALSSTFGSLGAHIAAAGVVVGSVAMNVIVLAIVSWY